MSNLIPGINVTTENITTNYNYDLHVRIAQPGSRRPRNHGNHRLLAARTDHLRYTLAVLALW